MKLLYTLIFAFFISCSTEPIKKEIYYEVVGSADKVSITLTNQQGNTVQFTDIKLPYHQRYTVNKRDFIYISAQNEGSYGSVTANIYVNKKGDYNKGQLFQTATSSGGYVIASASGSCP